MKRLGKINNKPIIEVSTINDIPVNAIGKVDNDYYENLGGGNYIKVSINRTFIYNNNIEIYKITKSKYYNNFLGIKCTDIVPKTIPSSLEANNTNKIITISNSILIFSSLEFIKKNITGFILPWYEIEDTDLKSTDYKIERIFELPEDIDSIDVNSVNTFSMRNYTYTEEEKEKIKAEYLQKVKE